MAFTNKFFQRLIRSLSGVLAGSSLLLVSELAHASLNYPTYLAQNYGATGDCTLCHTDNNGEAGTVSRAFGKTLQSKGLLGVANTASLDAAIAALGNADSDGDGATDLVELSENGNPNDPAVLPGGFVAPEKVEYGCVGGTIAGRTESNSNVALAAAGFVAAALLWSRHRRGV